MDNLIDWFTDRLTRIMALITPSHFSDDTLAGRIAKLREQSREELKKQGIVVDTRPDAQGKTRESIMHDGIRLYPHESSEMRKGVLVLKFRFDDIMRPNEKNYANITIEIDADGRVVNTINTL